ncbi:hypothetical protein [Klebsiella sp. BIGb0407]|uniref:hypothetical protein n=1 Tax=Klebsiella sp. BIGb0407 TaxID=2940603 RepID=UPI0021677739|nr:hypothetical protein [Klebsiella sp. BIGb0407]MCS3430344.1 hypothetical protein [Klebsiella sp. BIGb0407]
MPVSASQHRIISGSYQNKLHASINSNTSSVQSRGLTQSTLPDEIYRFGKNISRIINSYEKQHDLSSQDQVSSPSIVVPVLLLLSQIKLTCKPSFISDGKLSLPFTDNINRQNNRNNHSNTLLDPVLNILYKTEGFISQYDPLIFPGASVESLSVATPESVIIKDNPFFSKEIFQKVTELISSLSNDKESIAIKEMINELNSITVKAKKESPYNSNTDNKINYLISLIDESKNIIDKFEIKYGQENICKMLSSQREYYIEMAHNISDIESQSIFYRYIESLPPLIFTPDSRGDPYPSVQSQIADRLVRSVFGFEHILENIIEYGSHYEAYKSLLICLLAEKKIDSVNNLHADWDKGDEALRLVNLLFRDLEFKLQNKRAMYLLPSAEIFYQSYRESLFKDSTLSTTGRKLLLKDADRNRLLFLREHLKKPINIEYNQKPDGMRFIKLLDLLVTIQCITEVMYDSHLPDRRTDSHDQKCKSTENLKLEYNSNTQGLTIHATSVKIGKLKENNVKMAKIISENKMIGNIKFKPILSLRRVKNRSSTSKELKNRIRPSMYANNIKRNHICGVDDMGLRYDNKGNTYLRINKHFIQTTHITLLPDINNRYYIKANKNKNLYLRFREDGKFYPENITERLNINKIIDSVGITTNERHALYTYGLADHNDIKTFIMEGMPKNYHSPELRGFIVKTIDDIQNALPKMPLYESNVFKSIFIDKETLNSLKKNQLITSRIFLSCAKRPEKARKLSRSLTKPQNTDKNHHLLINFNINKSGHSIEWYTEKFDEEEVLIESNQFFNIRKIKLNFSGESLVILDEIDSSLLSEEDKVLAKNINS